MRSFDVGDRLRSCAELVREGAVLADVGTDHAYLPIYLLSTGKISRAILSDINQGPLDKARENAERHGMLDKVAFVLCNGAKELLKYAPTDYCICGMGGELIVDIISHAPGLMNKNVHLILQPMTKPEVLRDYLYRNGFSIICESYSYEDGKHYVAMLARYTSECLEPTLADAYFGMRDTLRIGDAYPGYVARKKAALEAVIEGKRLGGADASYEKYLLDEISNRM